MLDNSKLHELAQTLGLSRHDLGASVMFALRSQLVKHIDAAVMFDALSAMPNAQGVILLVVAPHKATHFHRQLKHKLTSSGHCTKKHTKECRATINPVKQFALDNKLLLRSSMIEILYRRDFKII